MIKLCGVQLSQLPDYRTLTSLLREPFYLSWWERHKSIRDEQAARASLGGILLLQLQGVDGRLVYDDNSRPFLEGAHLDFNLTHTENAVFCAIQTEDAGSNTRAFGSDPYPRNFRVGLDAEALGRLASTRFCPMAERWFSRREQELFKKDPTEESFLRIWTRKEALVKWTGKGLAALRSADTALATEAYGVAFHEYWVGSTLVTLCCDKNALPPSSVEMYSNIDFLR